MNKNNSVILDCDTGEDDALAILVAVINNLPLRYVVSSYGNTSIENSTKNSSELLSLSNAKDIKVIRGSKKPLQKHSIENEFTAGDFVGKNGICNVELPKSKYDNIVSFPDAEFPKELATILQKEAPVDYIITGPCTNFARVFDVLGQDTAKYVKRLYIMGGAVKASGNSGPKNPETGKPYAEFNFYGDPVAVDTVLKSGIPIYLVTWDVTSTVTIPYDAIDRFQTKSEIGEFTKTLMKNFFTYYGLSHNRNFELNDPLTVLALMGYGEYQTEKIRVITEGKEYGRIVSDPNGTPIHYFLLSEEEKRETTEKILRDLDIVRS